MPGRSKSRYNRDMTLETLKKWDRETYYRMGEQGIFSPDERVELIEGVIHQLSPQNKTHARMVTRLTMLFTDLFRATHVVRVQLPLDLGDSQPEPDLTLVTLEEEENCPLHPRTADLVVEVSESSLTYDRVEKASLYAKFGLPELWIVMPGSQRLEICRNPVPDSSAPYGYAYGHRVTHDLSATVTPLFADEVAIQIG